MRIGGWPAYPLAQQYGLQLYLVETGEAISIEEWSVRNLARHPTQRQSLSVEVEVPDGAKVVFVLDTSGGSYDEWDLKVQGVVESAEEAERWVAEARKIEPDMNHSATPFILGRLS